MLDRTLLPFALLLGVFLTSASSAPTDPSLASAQRSAPTQSRPSGISSSGGSSVQSRPSASPSRPSVQQSRPSVQQSRPSVPQSRPSAPAPQARPSSPSAGAPRVVPSPQSVRPSSTPSTGGALRPAPVRASEPAPAPSSRWSPSRGYASEADRPSAAAPYQPAERAASAPRAGVTSSTLTDRQGSSTREHSLFDTSRRAVTQPGIVDLRGAARPVVRTEVPRLVGSTEAPSSVRRRALEAPDRSGARLVVPRPGTDRQLGEGDLLERYRVPASRTRAADEPLRPATGARTAPPARTPAVGRRAEASLERDLGPASTRRRGLEEARRAALQRIDPDGARGGTAQIGAQRPSRDAASAAGRAAPRSAPTSVPSSMPATPREITEVRQRHRETLAGDPELRSRVQAGGLAAATAMDVAVRTSLGAVTGGVVTGAWVGDMGGGSGGDWNGHWDGHHNHHHHHYWFWHHWYPSYCGWWGGGYYGWAFGFGWGSWGYWPHHYSSWWYPWYYRPYYVSYVPWSYWYTAPVVSYHYTTVVQEESYAGQGLVQQSVVTEEAPYEDHAAAGGGYGVAPQTATSGAMHRAALEYLALGDRAFVEARYGDAVRFYAKAIEFEPRDGVLYLVLSDALFATGDYHYAAFALRRGLELEPDLAAVVDKRRYYGDPTHFDRHLALLESYLEDHFLDDDARLVLAANYLFGALPERAIELLESPFSAEVAATPAAALVLSAAHRAVEPPIPVEDAHPR